MEKEFKMEKIYLCLAQMSENGAEMNFIQKAFDSNWVVPLGPNVDGFESDLREFIGGEKEIVALSSGTAAVHLALLSCGVGVGDEVIVQSFTFCASSHPVVYLGASPVFVDSEKETWNMDPTLLEKAILNRIENTGRKPKAIVVVHLYGMPAKMDEIMEVARRYDIPLIEDAAEAFGSQYHDKMCGTFGKYGVFSFNGNKMITTSGGGAVITSSIEEKERILWRATQAREAFPYYQHEEIGFNYRLSNICAGIGRGQMTVANEHIAHHQHIADLYRSAFSSMQGIVFHDAPTSNVSPNYWLNTILIDENLRINGEGNVYTNKVKKTVGGVAGMTRKSENLHSKSEPNSNVEALRIALDLAGIESRPLWKPMHLQPVYQKNIAFVNGVSESLFHCGLCLPSGPMVSDDDVMRIVKTIKDSIL